MCATYDYKSQFHLRLDFSKLRPEQRHISEKLDSFLKRLMPVFVHEYVKLCKDNDLPCGNELTLLVTSAYRTVDDNNACGGAKNSAHLFGLALDVATPTNAIKVALVRSLLKSKCVRIGIAKTYVHFDVDAQKPLAIWTY